MKKKTIISSLLLLATACFTACDKDKPNNTIQTKALLPVEFPEVAKQVLNRKPTGNVIGNKQEYLQVVRRQISVSPVGLIDGTNSELIFPGSVLSGDAFMEGEYSPIIIKDATPVTISASLKGESYKVSEKALPVGSDVRQAINELIQSKAAKPDYENAPFYMSYNSDEVTTAESFNKSFGLHTKLNILAGLVQTKFDYSISTNKSKKTKYILVKVKQHLYDLSVDPKGADSWGTFTGIGKYEPLYVSNVQYGRLAYLLVETEENADSIGKLFKAGVEVGLASFSGSVETTYSRNITKLFKSNKVRILIAGGPINLASRVNDYSSLIDFLKLPLAVNMVKSAVPIGFTVRSIKTNREVEVRTTYTEEELAYE